MANNNRLSNDPPVTVEFTAEQGEFIVHNCNRNLEFALQAMMSLSNTTNTSESSTRAMISLMESFKGIKEVLVKAGISPNC